MFEAYHPQELNTEKFPQTIQFIIIEGLKLKI
jgi:hypothetical protein